MFIVQVNDNEGVLRNIPHIGADRATAEQRFLGACEELISNWSDYVPADVAAVLDRGYEQYGNGVVILIDTDGFTSDDEIRDELTKQPAGDMTVAEVVHDGEVTLAVGMTVDEILESCGRNLDSCESHEIQGQILFKGSDGVWYTITTESTIGQAAPEWLAETLAEAKHE